MSPALYSNLMSLWVLDPRFVRLPTLLICVPYWAGKEQKANDVLIYSARNRGESKQQAVPGEEAR